jgi:hypothetical protein
MRKSFLLSRKEIALVSIDPSGRGAFEKPGGKGRDPGAGRTEITVI